MEGALELGILIAMTAALWLTANWLKQRRWGKGAVPAIEVRQRCALTSQCQLAVVIWDGREMLLAATANQPCVVLASAPASPARSGV